MKTPEEIKKSLEMCVEQKMKNCAQCPHGYNCAQCPHGYNCDTYNCDKDEEFAKIASNALAYIRQLESRQDEIERKLSAVQDCLHRWF